MCLLKTQIIIHYNIYFECGLQDSLLFTAGCFIGIYLAAYECWAGDGGFPVW